MVKREPLNKTVKTEVATQVSPKPSEPAKLVISSISFDKNGNLYGVSGSDVYVFSFDTKKWGLI